VSGATTFLNTGSLTLGNDVNDSLAFDGGLVATAPSGLSLGGTVGTTNTAMVLGDNDTALVLNDHLTLTTAGGALAIHGAVNGSTANIESLTLNAGATGLVDVTGAIGQSTSLKTLTLAHSNGAVFNAPVKAVPEVLLSNTTAGQTIRFADDLSTAALTTTANAYHLALVGGSTRVSGATTFLNTGILTLGNDVNDSLAFDGGLVATAPSGLSLGGTVGTTNTAMVLGDNDTALVLNDHLTLMTAGGALAIQWRSQWQHRQHTVVDVECWCNRSGGCDGCHWPKHITQDLDTEPQQRCHLPCACESGHCGGAEQHHRRSNHSLCR
jgi:hypothetical protein